MKPYNEQDLQGALDAVASGASIHQSAQEYGIPRSTLRNRIKGHQRRSEAFAY